MTVKPLNGRARKKKYVGITNGYDPRIRFKKKALKGLYKFEVTSAGNAGFNETKKTIEIKVR